MKTKGAQTATQLARRLGVSPVAVRGHLGQLVEEGRVRFEDEAGRVGRPRRIWRLTPAADEAFPDSHAELALGMLDAVEDAFGPEGLEALVRTRTRRQLAQYKERLAGADSLAERVRLLAALRREEGYLAEWSRHSDGSLRLVENHCPICAAADRCRGLCAGELELFRRALGKGVRVEREEYLLEGARRCTYRIQGPAED